MRTRDFGKNHCLLESFFWSTLDDIVKNEAINSAFTRGSSTGVEINTPAKYAAILFYKVYISFCTYLV